MNEQTTSLGSVIDQLNNEFLKVHTSKENLFWETKMGLTPDPIQSQKKLSKAEIEAQQFAQNHDALKQLRSFEGKNHSTPEEQTALKGWIEYFAANIIEDKKAQALAHEIIELEGELQAARNAMKLGYADPATNQFVDATSTILSNMLRVESSEALRKAAFEGLRSIEPYVIDHGFLEIVKKRNALGRMLGYEDYYDMKVSRTEGFSKKKLFELLDDLEVRTREHAKASVAAFIKEKGETAREAWNFSYLRAGDLIAETDPYLPFADSLDRWVRSFAALGIKFRGATLTLDLIDRKGKYENGFMHGPGPAYFDKGAWKPARINFTANAIPDKVGAGFRALETLFHEGGHAAHFSNILMNAPCFSQEFAPTSVAYAETQSMFLDSILSDADWQTRYAKNAKGEAMPASLIEKTIRQEQPFLSLGIRGMLTICFAEKALYEMPEKELTKENVIKMFRELEQRTQFLNAGVRPILAVPHLLAGESSAYYHGYVLAEMAVEQTRAYFKSKYGYITDNPNVGPELAQGYWAPGNSKKFMDLVAELTGKPFSADALVTSATRSVDTSLNEMRETIERVQKTPKYSGPLDLDADVRIVHGNETIAEFKNGTFGDANRAFSDWIHTRFSSSK